MFMLLNGPDVLRTRRYDSKPFYPKTEKEVFDLFGLEWVDPTWRNADVLLPRGTIKLYLPLFYAPTISRSLKICTEYAALCRKVPDKHV